MTGQVAVRIVCGAKGGRCGRLLAVVRSEPGELRLAVTSPDRERTWRVRIPADLNGGTPYLLDCPSHDPDSYIHRPGWESKSSDLSPTPEFPFSLLATPLSRWQVSGKPQTLRWDRHH